jgi:hypothetical protein
MRLANDEMILTFSPSVTVILRASLRAAFHVHNKYGFEALYLAIAEGNLTAIVDLISATCTNQPTFVRYVASEDPSIVPELLATRARLLEFIPGLCGVNDKSGEEPQSGEPLSFEEYFTQLYQIGTGWLGWTARDTWDATPAEIINAKEGRVEMLAAIFGKRDDTETIDATKGIPADVRAEINAIGKGKR